LDLDGEPKAQKKIKKSMKSKIQTEIPKSDFLFGFLNSKFSRIIFLQRKCVEKLKKIFSTEF
jgi:hypothetical protein